jgi:hypothetical protein
MENKTEDPIDRIRRTRHEISAKYDHDPRKLVEHYMELQKKHADRLIFSPGPAEDVRKPA